MRDYISSAIARTLQIPLRQIVLWRITVGQGSRSSRSLGGGSHNVLGMIEAELEVKLDLDAATAKHLQYIADTGKGSVVIKRAHVAQHLGTERTDLDVGLFYGKETEHIFKALYQTMTVRGPQKRKKK